MQISKHFTLAELTRSTRATQQGVDNSPTEAHKANLVVLAEKIMEPVREHFGPYTPSSCYRSAALNAVTPGSSGTSQHCKGEAVDIDLGSKEKNKELFDFVTQHLEYDQVIDEFDYSWVHISFTLAKKNRKQRLKAVKKNGKTTYLPG